MVETQQTRVNNENVNEKKRGRPSGITFPRDPLKRALMLADAIEKNNAGQPFDRLDLAKAVNYSPNSSGFRVLIISAGRYGLTDGGYMAEKIALTSLGSAIVSPTADDNVNAKLRQALTTPDVFRKVLERFNKKNIPREDVFKNTLKKEFGVDPSDVDTCYEVLMQNITYFGLSQDFKGNKFLNLDKLGEVIVSSTLSKTEDIEATQHEETVITPVESLSPTIEKQIPRVFISHSKNQNILDQLKTILEFGKFGYTIAEEVETAAIPIPDKIFGLMRGCNCAIINISADNELKNEDESYRINENVLIEIGAAFVHYDRRVILLVDKRITLPSNLQGLSRCEYDGNELSFIVAMKLQKILTEFREKI
jgi:predicted nucleotide-binding protein